MTIDPDLDYARFVLTSEQVGVPSWLSPVSGAWGVSRLSGMKISRLEFDPSTARISDIGRMCSDLGRSQWWSILEKDRLNLEKMRFFFIRLIRDIGFLVFYRNLINSMRLWYLIIFEEKAPRVPRVEEELNNSIPQTLVEEKIGLNKSGQIVWLGGEELSLVKLKKEVKVGSGEEVWCCWWGCVCLDSVPAYSRSVWSSEWAQSSGGQGGGNEGPEDQGDQGS